MGEKRKAPRWVTPFLRALERAREVEAAARDAGIDKTSAYNRRRAHPDFAEAWQEALRIHADLAAEEVQERVEHWEGLKGQVPLAADAPAVRENDGLLASTALGGKMVKAGAGRWNKGVEQRFFDELAATANVKRACAAAEVSTNAVYARRTKRPDFRAKWDAVLETARAAIEMHLVETARKSFEPDEVDFTGVEPKVSVAEAIKIVQLHGGKSKAAAENTAPAEAGPADAEALRERVFAKLQRLRLREYERLEAEGWSYDLEHDQMVPPGWVKAAG